MGVGLFGGDGGLGGVGGQRSAGARLSRHAILVRMMKLLLVLGLVVAIAPAAPAQELLPLDDLVAADYAAQPSFLVSSWEVGNQGEFRTYRAEIGNDVVGPWHVTLGVNEIGETFLLEALGTIEPPAKILPASADYVGSWSGYLLRGHFQQGILTVTVAGPEVVQLTRFGLEVEAVRVEYEFQNYKGVVWLEPGRGIVKVDFDAYLHDFEHEVKYMNGVLALQRSWGKLKSFFGRD